MRKIKEKRMQSYVLRARKLVQEGKNKEGTEMLNDGMNYYSKNIIRALSPYATADAGIVSMVLRNFADDIEKNNPGAKELRIWVENNSTKPELKEEIKVAIPFWGEATEEFNDPTPLSEDINWKLEIVLPCRQGIRTKSMTELLFCMLRSGR